MFLENNYDRYCENSLSGRTRGRAQAETRRSPAITTFKIERVLAVEKVRSGNKNMNWDGINGNGKVRTK